MKQLSILLAALLLLTLLTGCGSGKIEPAAQEQFDAPTEPGITEPASVPSGKTEPVPTVPKETEAAPIASECTERPPTEPAATEPLPTEPPLVLDEKVDFSVDTVSGETFSVAEALDTADLVLINLWATWCPPCAYEFPFLQEAWEQYRDRVAVIALSVEQTDSAAVLRAYAQEAGLTFPMGNDNETGLAWTFQVNAIPTSVYVDRFGNIALIEVGAKGSVEEFTQIFDYFLREDYTGEEVRNGPLEALP